MNENKALQAKTLVVVDTAKLVSRLEFQMKQIGDELSIQKASAEADRTEFKNMMAQMLQENSRLRANQVVIESQENDRAHPAGMIALQDEIASLRAEIAQRDLRSTEVSQLVTILREELGKEKSLGEIQHKSLEEEVEQIRHDNTSRDQAIKHSQQILEVLKGSYEEKVEKIQAELAELREALRVFEKMQAALSDDKFDRKLGNGLMEELATVRNESDSLKQELKKMLDENSHFKQNISKDHRENEALVADFHTRIQKAEMFCVKLGHSIDAIKADNKVYDESNSAFKKDLAQLEYVLEEIKRRIAESNEIRKTAAVNTHSEIQRIKDKSHSDIESLRSELKGLRDVIEQLQSENQILRRDLTNDTEKRQRLTNDMAKLTEESDRNKKELLLSKKELEQAFKKDEAIASLQVSLYELQQKYESVEKEHQEQQREIASLRANQERSQIQLIKHQEGSKQSKSKALEKTAKKNEAMANLQLSLKELQLKYEKADIERQEQQSVIARLRANQEKLESKLRKDQESSKQSNNKMGAVTRSRNSPESPTVNSVSQNPNGHFSGKGTRKKNRDVEAEVRDLQNTKTAPTVEGFVHLKPKSVSKEKVTAGIVNSKCSLEEVSEFFELLKFGLVSQINGCLKRRPDLLSVKSRIHDFDNKMFEDITALQYAFYQRDIQLCRLFLNKLTPEEANRQKCALHKAIPVFSFDTVIDVIEHYRQNCRTWSVQKRIEYWAHTVASAQASLPAWVIHLWSESGDKVAWTLKNPKLEFSRQREWIQLWYNHYEHILGDKTNKGMGWSRGLKNHPEAVFADGQMVPSEQDAAHQVDFLRNVDSAVKQDLAEILEEDSAKLCIGPTASLIHLFK